MSANIIRFPDGQAQTSFVDPPPAEYATDYNFNVWRRNGEWVMVRPDPSMPHCSTNQHANREAERIAASNRKRGCQQ